MATYSFQDVAAAIVGVGGSINLASGAAVAEEGITIEAVEDKNIMTIGADGVIADWRVDLAEFEAATPEAPNDRA